MGEGRIQLDVLPNGIIETRCVGVITRADLERWAVAIRALRASRPKPARLLFDALGVSGLVPGSAFVAVRSAREHAGQTLASAFVVRSPGLVGVASAFLILMPHARRGMFGTREDALAFLESRGPRERASAHVG